MIDVEINKVEVLIKEVVVRINIIKEVEVEIKDDERGIRK